jgi:hypothetical protein
MGKGDPEASSDGSKKMRPGNEFGAGQNGLFPESLQYLKNFFDYAPITDD